MAEIASDKKQIVKKIEICIHPLKPESHPEQLVNEANRTIWHSQLLDLRIIYLLIYY